MEPKLAGTAALVTGASSGIGAATPACSPNMVRPSPPVAARLAINARPVAGTSGSSQASRRDDSGGPNRQLAASASQKNGKAKHPRPAARNDTLPLW